MSRFAYTSNKGLVLIYNKEKVNEVIDFVNNFQDLIIDNIQESSIAVYDFIIKECNKGDIKRNLVFQFIFSSFYGLNNAGLTNEFKDLYFDLFDSNKDKPVMDFKDVLYKLSQVKNHKGQNSLQFSFTTKMFHTIDSTYPIYDNEIASLFGFRQPYSQKDINIKISIYLDQYEQIKYTYNKMISDKLIKSAVDIFNLRFGKFSIPETKIHDFIFWSAGKIKNKKIIMPTNMES